MREVPTLELAGVRWWLGQGLDAARLSPRLGRALAQLASARDLRSGRRKRLFRLALGDGPESDHLLKRSAYPFARGWLRRVDGSKARRELAIAQALAAQGVPVVLPLAAGERRSRGRVAECFLLTPLLAGARDLRACWAEPQRTARERRALAASLGALIRRAHAAGLHQNDLAPNNVLVCVGVDGALGAGPDGPLRLIDFERARLRARASERARRRMLAKLARGAAGASATQRLRFLRAYAGDRAAAREWWARLREEAPRLARRDDTRLRRSAARDGRRFERVAIGSWRGFARRGVPLAAALAIPLPAAPLPGEAPLIVSGPGSWSVVHPRSSERGARELWARANALAARGLGPAPLACVSDRTRMRLIVAADAGLRPLAGDAAARSALARLLAELCALGELRGELSPRLFAVVPGAHARALLVAPDAFRFVGRAGGARTRAVAARLLARLDPG